MECRTHLDFVLDARALSAQSKLADRHGVNVLEWTQMLKRITQNFLGAWRYPRWRLALLVAVISDALSFGVVLLPPVQWVVDAVTAVVLFAVLGFRWSLLTALVIESVPILELFPAWTLAVSALAGMEKRTPPVDPRVVEAASRPVQNRRQ